MKPGSCPLEISQLDEHSLPGQYYIMAMITTPNMCSSWPHLVSLIIIEYLSKKSPSPGPNLSR